MAVNAGDEQVIACPHPSTKAYPFDEPQRAEACDPGVRQTERVPDMAGSGRRHEKRVVPETEEGKGGRGVQNGAFQTCSDMFRHVQTCSATDRCGMGMGRLPMCCPPELYFHHSINSILREKHVSYFCFN